MYLIVDEAAERGTKKIISAKSDIFAARQTIMRLRHYMGASSWDRFTVGEVDVDEEDEDIISRVAIVDRDKVNWDWEPRY